MFVDASALCAILLDEPEARDFVARIEAADEVWTSAIAIYEVTLAVSRVNCGQVADAARRVMTLLQTLTVAISTIGDAEADAALDAYARFCKGRHPARLNMGDCFAYACARTHGVPLLFKGEDFALTDVGGRQATTQRRRRARSMVRLGSRHGGSKMMSAIALVAAAISVAVHPAGPDRTCAPAMDNAFVHVLPSTKIAGTLLQPLAMRQITHASPKNNRRDRRGCAEFVG